MAVVNQKYGFPESMGAPEGSSGRAVLEEKRLLFSGEMCSGSSLI